MLGRRKAQHSFFNAQGMPTRVPPDSFYGRMGALGDVLFKDDDLKDMYDPGNGRPSLSPALLSGVLLLQFYDDVSDEEAVERTLFDLRWKVALDLPIDYAGFDPSSLSYFRKRLIENGQERYAFDRLVQVAREAGFLPDRATLLTDTVHAKGAGAVQDTYTLIRKGIRQLLKRCGFHLPGKRPGLAPQTQALLATYLDQNRKAAIDWADPVQRAAQLKTLVQDAEAALEVAADQRDDPEVRAAGWLLTKILGDDIVTNDQGKPQLGQGTAPDRIISITDPEMRHGRKSKASRFDGFKVAVTTEQTSELIVDVADLPAPGSDGRALLPMVQRVEAQVGVTVERVIADGAYGSGDHRAECANYPGHPIDLVSPLGQPCDPEVAKSAFELDEAARTATCPQGHTTTGQVDHDEQGREILTFSFARSVCAACPLFPRCVRSRTKGRTVQTHAHESYLRAARLRQGTDEFKTLYRLRCAIERKGAELVKHGLRGTRYRGRSKRQLQRLWLAAVVNLKRLFKLAEQLGAELRAHLSQVRPRQAGWSPVRSG
jgi:transposase